ncbi:DUF4173 domain-containing protein, partial [Luedemannella flava]|uniref:DUF4153 domain-containing protein n=1 Tax=Luedemannella flava TaxID=349316 RepID=UPI0031DB965F
AAPPGVVPAPAAPGVAPYAVFYPNQPRQPLPPIVPFFGKRWPGPGDGKNRAVPYAVLAGALSFAVFVPLSRVGIGWLLGGLGAGIAAGVVARLGDAKLTTTDRVFRAIWGASALALLSVLAFRNAWWLVTFCVLGALGCATLAVVGGRSIRALLFGPFAVAAASMRGLPWLAGNLRSDEASDGADEAAGGEATPNRAGRLVWSIGATVLLLLIFGGLFASADAAFADVLEKIVPDIDAGTVWLWLFLFIAGGLATLAAVYLVSAPIDLAGMHTPARARLGRLEWALPIGGMVLLFLGFVVIQITVLFGGSDHVLDANGPTYAEYARSGFWQLMWATILTLAVIAATIRWASAEQPGDRLVLRILLGSLSALSMVIVASALSRMYTYQQAYSFTGERIFVMGFELLLGLAFLMIIVAGAVWNGSWIPRAGVGTMVVLLLALAVMNPEAYAAKRNVDRFNETGKIDLYYLAALRADATAELAKLPPDARKCALSKIDDRLREPDPWYAWNLGREQARKVLRDLGPGASGNCRNARKYDYPANP